MANEWTRLTKKQRSGGVMAYREEFGDHAIAQGELYEDKFDMYKYGQRVSLTPAELLALAIITEVWREVAEVQALAEALREIEWINWRGRDICYLCGNAEREGHAEGCSIGIALFPFQEPTDA